MTVMMMMMMMMTTTMIMIFDSVQKSTQDLLDQAHLGRVWLPLLIAS